MVMYRHSQPPGSAAYGGRTGKAWRVKTDTQVVYDLHLPASVLTLCGVWQRPR
jgi:hypothetical protein